MEHLQSEEPFSSDPYFNYLPTYIICEYIIISVLKVYVHQDSRSAYIKTMSKQMSFTENLIIIFSMYSLLCVSINILWHLVVLSRETITCTLYSKIFGPTAFFSVKETNTLCLTQLAEANQILRSAQEWLRLKTSHMICYCNWFIV